MSTEWPKPTKLLLILGGRVPGGASLMLKISFYPDSDKPELVKAARRYQEIWDKEGREIVEVIEKISGLRFKEKFVANN